MHVLSCEGVYLKMDQGGGEDCNARFMIKRVNSYSCMGLRIYMFHHISQEAAHTFDHFLY